MGLKQIKVLDKRKLFITKKHPFLWMRKKKQGDKDFLSEDEEDELEEELYDDWF